MRPSNPVDRIHFIYMAEMFRLDPDDKLEMEPHEFLGGVQCITHTQTKRSLQVRRGLSQIELDYLNTDVPVVGRLTVLDPIEAAERSIAFLNGDKDEI